MRSMRAPSLISRTVPMNITVAPAERLASWNCRNSVAASKAVSWTLIILLPVCQERPTTSIGGSEAELLERRIGACRIFQYARHIRIDPRRRPIALHLDGDGEVGEVRLRSRGLSRIDRQLRIDLEIDSLAQQV